MIMKKSFFRWVSLCAFFGHLFFLANGEALADVRRVPSQHPTIQQAIDASVNGDTVLVAPGTYIENIDFKGKAITVASEAGPQTTIIDGNQDGSVVKFVSGEGRSSILSGFTLQNGFGFGDHGGGGVQMNNSSPKIINNIITNNGACEGPGVFISSGSPLIQSNLITGNTQQGCSGGLGGGGIFIGNLSRAEIIDNTISFNFMGASGGGVKVEAASPKILRNTITNNVALGGGGISTSGIPSSVLIEGNAITHNSGSAGAGGGGIEVAGFSAVEIINNLISNNTASSNHFGGGISVAGARSALIRGNVIRENEASSGGGIYLDGQETGTRVLVQNLIVKNHGWGAGGGISVNSTFTMVSNTIADNDSPVGSAIAGNHYPGSKMINNIVVARAGQTSFSCGVILAPPALINNNFFSPGGNVFQDCDFLLPAGNISADPLFVNPAMGDYHLQPNSPSMDAGDNNAPSLPAADIDGNARILDGNADGLAVIDQGVDEVVPPFDLCIQDESNGNILQINSATGDYHFFNCSGFIASGKGILIKKGNTLTLQHNAADRRVTVRIDSSSKRATASIQLFSQGSFSIFDRNISNNSCGCR
jgi:hypothetical protein